MSRRSERRDEDIMAAVLVGVGLLRRIFGGPHRAQRRMARVPRATPLRTGRGPSGWGSLAMMVFMVGAFIVLGLFLAVIASLRALEPIAGMLCLALPWLTLAFPFVVWGVRRKRSADQPLDTADHTRAAAGGQYSWERAMGAGDRAVAPATKAAPSAQQPIPLRERTLREDHSERGLRPPSEYRQRATSYRRRIESLLKKRRPGPLANRLRAVLDKLKSWEERVGQLADRVVIFETDDLIQRDLREVPGHIDRLKRQILAEGDPEMRRQIGKTLGAYEEQLRQLQLLARVMRRTRLNLDDTLAAMGTVYSQVQVLNAMDLDAPVAARIDDEIGREVERLNDMMTALSEVYASSNGRGEARPASVDEEVEAGLDARRSRLNRTTY